MSNIRTHLQQQYNKLQSRINKAIQSGKFYEYTAYKQQQLQARLQRYALQMRQLATGVAVCAALGVALPTSGQLQTMNLVERTGTANPLDSLINSNKISVFVDIDGDADLDMFQSISNYTSSNRQYAYYENVGAAHNPAYVNRIAANNLVGHIDNIINLNLYLTYAIIMKSEQSITN